MSHVPGHNLITYIGSGLVLVIITLSGVQAGHKPFSQRWESVYGEIRWFSWAGVPALIGITLFASACVQVCSTDYISAGNEGS